MDSVGILDLENIAGDTLTSKIWLFTQAVYLHAALGQALVFMQGIRHEEYVERHRRRVQDQILEQDGKAKASKHAEVGVDEVCYSDVDDVSQYTQCPQEAS